MEGGISGINGGLPAWEIPNLNGPAKARGPEFDPALSGTQSTAAPGRTQDFGRMLTQFIDGVNDTQKSAEMETRKVLMGQTNNLHQAMIAGEESGLALRLMVEVRNKLVEGFQEVMRMQV